MKMARDSKTPDGSEQVSTPMAMTSNGDEDTPVSADSSLAISNHVRV